VAGPRAAKPAPSSAVTWSRIARRIRVPLGFVFALFYFWRARPTWPYFALGVVIVFLGVFVRAVASGHVKKNQELAQTGPYAYVRNPLYLGSLIIATGFVVIARDLWIAAVVVLMFGMIYVPVISSEEEHLRSQFPQYESYARRVPRLWPRRMRFSGLTADFSRELYLRHREYNAVLGAVATLAALAAKILWFTRTT